MTSVPHIHHSDSRYLGPQVKRPSIHQDQIKLRHIKSIVIKNVRLNGTAEKDEIRGDGNHKFQNSSRLLRSKTKSTLNLTPSKLSLRSHQASTDFDLVSNNEKQRWLNEYKGNDSSLDHYLEDRYRASFSTRIKGLSEQVERQLQLQSLNSKIFVESFYTINNFLDIEHPLYISRVFSGSEDISEDINFSSLNRNSITINLFTKVKNVWKFLTQFNLKFSFLINVGDNRELIDHYFKKVPNFLLLQLVDGCYYIQANNNISLDLIGFLQDQHNRQYQENLLHSAEQLTCSFDQIMKLNNLSVCIVDLLKVKKDLGERLETLMKASGVDHADSVTSYQNKVGYLRKVLDKETQANEVLQKKIEDLRSLSELKRKALCTPFQEDKYKQQNELAQLLVQLESSSNKISKQKARVAKILSFIFPIEPTKGTSEFQLLGYKLPQNFSVLKMARSEIESTNAVLGYLVILLSKLSIYLKVPLRYPLKFFGSNSYIVDPISKIQTKLRIYPLFIVQNGGWALRFEFGLSLLMKNLHQLFEVEDLIKVDDYHLLGNFKILLTCLASEDRDNNHDQLNEILISKDRINHIKKHLLKR